VRVVSDIVSTALDDSWATQHLNGFLTALTNCGEPAVATAAAARAAVEAMEAVGAAVLVDGEVSATVGVVNDAPPTQLAAVARGERDTLQFDGSASLSALAACAQGGAPTTLVVARPTGTSFCGAESELLGSMARVLALVLGSLRVATGRLGQTRQPQMPRQESAELIGTLQERQLLLERLTRVQRSIVSSTGLEAVLEAVAVGVSELLGGEASELHLLDPDHNGGLVLAAHHGLDSDQAMQVERIAIGDGVAGRAVADRRLVVMHDYSHHPRAMPFFSERGCQAAMAAPLYESGRVMGCLVVFTSRTGRRYSENEQQLLATYAEHASVAVTAARSLDEAVHRAFHDTLTGLPNRGLFLDRLAQTARRAERTQSAVAVLFMDLDGFKRVNDDLGHQAGDQVLFEVARRLLGCLRPADTAARFGGDEFAVLLEGLNSESDAALVASRIMGALNEPLVLHGRRVSLSASIGIALRHSADDDLMRNADLAMYRAKSRGKNRYAVFTPAMHAVIVERVHLESELQLALERREFALRYQPIVAIEDGALVGVEALIRWNHPERGLLCPDAFIPCAEESGLIAPIGRWVLNQACRQAMIWQESFGRSSPLAVSVNLSVTQLYQPGAVYEVAEALERSGLEPGCLIIEITETLLMNDVELIARTLDGLKRLGVQLAVDDFGTGYSSLQYLRRFPIDILKIAKSFVDGIAESGESALAQAIVDLGQSLALRVIAEGIETPEQVTRLNEMGCSWGQGYHFARPLEAATLTDLLERAGSAAGTTQSPTGGRLRLACGPSSALATL